MNQQVIADSLAPQVGQGLLSALREVHNGLLVRGEVLSREHVDSSGGAFGRNLDRRCWVGSMVKRCC